MTTKGDMVDYDTARQRLAIGSANQILQVKSSLPSWETVDLADTVLTTAGDVLFENATPELARLGAGTQYNNLQMGASLPAWSASSTSIMTGTGDTLYSSGANTLARLAIGSTDDVLTVAGGVPTWASAGGVTVTKVSAVMGSDFSTTSTTDVDVTDFVATLPTITSGLAWITATAETRVSLALYLYYFSMDNGATVAARAPYSGSPSNPPRLPTNVVYIDDADGGTIQMLLRTQAGTAYVYGEGISGLQILGVG
jgi:hypothetical protein